MRRQTQQLRRRKLPNNYDIKNINSHFTKGTKTTKPMTGHLNHVNTVVPLKSHIFGKLIKLPIIFTMLVETSLTVSESNTLFTTCLKHLREYIRRSKSYPKRLSQKISRKWVNKITFRAQVEAYYVHLTKTDYKLSAMLFCVMKGML